VKTGFVQYLISFVEQRYRYWWQE